MYVRKTELSDLDRVMEIYAEARRFMKAHGNPDQWGATNWPPQSVIEHDIAERNSYVCVGEGERIVGVFYYVHGKDIEPCYIDITDGGWFGESEYGVVHRIATDGTKGVGTYCLNWACDRSKTLRIDTHPANYVMQNLLTKLGFIKRGVIHVEEDDAPRFAFEKF